MFSNLHRATVALALTGFVFGCQAPPVPLGSRLASSAALPANGQSVEILPGTAFLEPRGMLPQLKAGMGYLSMRVHWPRRTQVIPLSAEIVHITILDPLGKPAVPLTVITRPANDDVISNVAIALPAARHLTIWTRAYRKAAVDSSVPTEVAVAVGSKTNVDVFDNVITPVSIDMKYLPITLSSISPDNGGVGAEITLRGIGFNGFVDPLNSTPSFVVRFTHQTVLEGDGNQVFAPVSDASPSAFTDLWIKAEPPFGPAATRDSDIVVRAMVPAGAVNGPVEYNVDGVAATPRKTFRVLKDLAIWKNPGKGTGPDHAAFNDVVLEAGDTQKFKARATDSLDVEHLNPAVTWSSSNPAAGTINASTGIFNARLPGLTTVTARTGILVKSVKVVVLNYGGTADIRVPLPAKGATTKVDIAFPDYDKGRIDGTANP
jgi:hypothetical protein